MTPAQQGAREDGAKSEPHRMSNLVNVLLRYLEARGVLVSLEAQEAFQQILRSIIFCAVAIVFGFTGWLLVVASAVDWIATAKGWSLAKTAFGAGVLHVLLAAAVFYLVMRRLSTTRWFAHTMNEFQKDRTWLAQQSEKQ